MNKKRQAIIASNEISELKTYTLNGYPQKVLIEGRKRDNPMILFLHGGPGTPIPFCEGCRGMFPEITEKFTMVYWDQLGCGINNFLIDDSFSVDTFAEMTIQLIKLLKKDYQGINFNIFAVSWGSVLAARAVLAVPELINRVMVYGQVLNRLFFNEEVFESLKNSPMPEKYKEKLSVIIKSDSPSFEEFKQMAGWIRKYTEGYQAKGGGKLPIGSILKGLMTSPDYSFADFKAIMINGYRKNRSLFSQLISLDLSEALKETKVPYLILQGEKDIVTSTRMISHFVKEAGNENLKCVLVKDSGHMPSAVGMDAVFNEGFHFLLNESTYTFDGEGKLV